LYEEVGWGIITKQGAKYRIHVVRPGQPPVRPAGIYNQMEVPSWAKKEDSTACSHAGGSSSQPSWAAAADSSANPFATKPAPQPQPEVPSLNPFRSDAPTALTSKPAVAPKKKPTKADKKAAAAEKKAAAEEQAILQNLPPPPSAMPDEVASDNPFRAAPTVPTVPTTTPSQQPAGPMLVAPPAAAPPAAAPAPKPQTALQKKAAAQRAADQKREDKEQKEKEKEKARVQKKKDRCCGVDPWYGCGGCIAIGIICTFYGSVLLSQGNVRGFGIVFTFDALASIGAMMFLFGPRKYCKGVFNKGTQRAAIGVLYWALIVLTIVLCCIPDVPVSVIILCVILQKVAWVVNLAASCGCLGGKPDPEVLELKNKAKNGVVKQAVKQQTGMGSSTKDRGGGGFGPYGI